MRRAKTLTGLFFQFFRMRWGALGKRGKILVLAGFVLAGVAAFQLGTCYLGGCQSASSPCDAPCSIDTAADEDAPCPYAARAEAEAAAAEAQADVPPCHRR